jgi:outer membrane protein OmpA-like peptidoglycan-associated protein
MKKTGFFVSVLVFVFFGSCGGTPPPAVNEPPPSNQPQPMGPALMVSIAQRFFSPDGDGVDDELLMIIDCKDESPIEEWKIEIREPGATNRIFFQSSGKGDPPGQFVWDGLGSGGELVQSAMDYPFTVTVTNNHKLSSSYDGTITTDVLVIREGNVMRIKIPSIVFASNSGGFAGLSENVLSGNDTILRRIAEILNKFNSYKVNVEGHANATAATANARRLEQERELRPLSEQRAKHVVDYLTRLGVDGGRLTAVGIGAARPVAAYEDRDNWWKNRRVEFILIK